MKIVDFKQKFLTLTKEQKDETIKGLLTSIKKGGRYYKTKYERAAIELLAWCEHHTADAYDCPRCHKKTQNIIGVCDDCESAGYWIDPAGGIHNAEYEDDPAAMYE